MGNELIKKSDLSPLLSKQEQSVVLASREIKIKDITEVEVSNKVNVLLVSTFAVLGHPNKEINEVFLMQKMIVKDLQEKFSNMTLKEVENAFYLGSRGQFKNSPDEVVFLSVLNVYNWLLKYQTETKRAAMKKQIDFEAKTAEVDTEQMRLQARELNIKSLKEEFQNFSEGKEIYDPVNVLYNFLDAEGLINLSNMRKRKIYEDVKERFKDKHIKAATIGDYAQNKKILQEMEAGSDRIEAIIKIKAKQAALKEVFQDIKDLGMTIEEFLNQEEE